MTNICYFLALLLCVSSAHAFDYCTLGADHTMCKYKPKACKHKLLKRGVTKADIATILKDHNEGRQKVAKGQQPGHPPASNMKELVWDKEIATLAQRWTDQCDFGHDKNRINAKKEHVGQNAAKSAYTESESHDANFTHAHFLWFNEVVNPGFKASGIKNFVLDRATGHYTQAVWADTNRIGCGYVLYDQHEWHNKYYICNYLPSGNVKGGVVYKEGAAASSCQGGVSKTYPGLCAS